MRTSCVSMRWVVFELWVWILVHNLGRRSGKRKQAGALKSWSLFSEVRDLSGVVRLTASSIKYVVCIRSNRQLSGLTSLKERLQAQARLWSGSF